MTPLRPQSQTTRTQSAQGLDAVFRPRSVALVGASAKPGSIGHRLLENLTNAGFSGPIYPISLSTASILGRAAFRSVLDVPGPIDLAVVAVPADRVLDVAQECGKKGVRALVVITAGFREAGPEGAVREEALRTILKQYGMRMVGPNCIGVANLASDVRLDATFAPVRPGAGRTAVMTQSGALGVALLNRANELGIGIAQFASMGNKTDVSGNDLLLFWEQDPHVSQILMYLESFGNPHNFTKIARRVSKTKPIIAVKSGRSTQGARAARSHTGALAEADRYIDALLDQCGVLRVSTVEELFDVALAVSLQPLPRGKRVAIVTNSGGPAIMAVDGLESAGLSLADLSPDTAARCAALLPPAATFGNPLDLLAGVKPAEFRHALEAVVGDPHVDAVIALCTPIWGDEAAMADAIAAAASSNPATPLVAVFFGQSVGSQALQALVQKGVPAYPFPENAVRSLGAARRILFFRERPVGSEPLFAKDQNAVARILEAAAKRGDEWLRHDEALDVFGAYGIPTARHAFVTSAEEAVRASAHVEFPIVMKAQVPGLIHKSDVGGVRLNIADERALRDAYETMQARLRSSGLPWEGALIMHQERPGLEILLGGAQDPRFGPLMTVGLGGIYAEILKDVAFHLAPMTDEDARRTIKALRAYPILQGTRGKAPSDLDALQRALVKLGRLAADFPQIQEIEANPFFLYDEGSGGVAVDARIRVPASAKGT